MLIRTKTLVGSNLRHDLPVQSVVTLPIPPKISAAFQRTRKPEVWLDLLISNKADLEEQAKYDPPPIVPAAIGLG
jgi:hypothetical protein